MAKNPTEALETLVKALTEAARTFPKAEAGKWEIGDDLLGKDPKGGKHSGHYKAFYDVFDNNINNKKIPFEKYEDQLVRLAQYIGVLARFQADAARPDAGDIRQAELDFAVAFAKKECHLMRQMFEARHVSSDGPRVLEIWCY